MEERNEVVAKHVGGIVLVDSFDEVVDELFFALALRHGNLDLCLEVFLVFACIDFLILQEKLAGKHVHSEEWHVVLGTIGGILHSLALVILDGDESVGYESCKLEIAGQVGCI